MKRVHSQSPIYRPNAIDFEINEEGEFIRQLPRFSTPFSETPSETSVISQKYRLILSKGCCWSNCLSILCDLLHLSRIVTIGYAEIHPKSPELGWSFFREKNGMDPFLNVHFLGELYLRTDPSFFGRATVPALIDVSTGKIVNNDFRNLPYYLETFFRSFDSNNTPDLYPVFLRNDIQQMNDWLYSHINNGVYQMFFAQKITAYEKAFSHFFDGLSTLDLRLKTQRFLSGDYITDSDVRLFVTLTRLDCSYYRFLGPIRQRLVDYKNLWDYARDLYSVKAFQRHTFFSEYAKERRVPGKEFQTFNARFWDQIDYEALWNSPQQRSLLSQTPLKLFF
ncbi:glutathione S-transferase C-terminal domain-containing protein [Suipraeoptans intestinalis]|uniref:glutathione S-transferase C-terminal domain-containing protein n=2 Tax=Suipraeoptans intestinalis TaxID=2606628 RepID=UPI002A75737B|nr:glutathione S-transferase C-terminal domain-containing protein [Suipraeoptans intestinalis]MDY3121361.1 glutathione S-transferase [Suipraeoptans intestinalis]